MSSILQKWAKVGCAPELLTYILLKFEKKDNITHFILQWSKYSMRREKWANSISHGAVITLFWDKSFNTTLTYAKRIRNTDNYSQSYFSAHLTKIPFALCSWTRWRKPQCQRRVYSTIFDYVQQIYIIYIINIYITNGGNYRLDKL